MSTSGKYTDMLSIDTVIKSPTVIFFLLMIYKFYERVSDEERLFTYVKKGWKRHGTTPLLVAFFRDGSVFFLMCVQPNNPWRLI